MKYTDEQLVAFLANELDEDSRIGIAGYIETSEAAQRRITELQALEQLLAGSMNYEAPAEMIYSFREKLASEKAAAAGRYRWYQAAAAILLVIASFAGGRWVTYSPPSSGEFGELKHEVMVLQQMVMINTLRTHSASERLRAIDMIEASSRSPGSDLITTLVQTMNNDESPNVRSAAVEVLGRYIDQDSVRVEMVHSLGEQDNPVVQIAMINLLIQAEDKTAIAPIKKIAENDHAPPEVRHTAEIALNMLI